MENNKYLFIQIDSMFTRSVSTIIFYDEKKRILLQNRDGHDKFGYEWGFFGGGIEKRETSKRAVERETYEELTFKLKEYSFFGKYIHMTSEWKITNNVFVAPLRNYKRKFVQKEGKGMRLFSIKSAKKLNMFPGDMQVLDSLEEYFKHEKNK